MTTVDFDLKCSRCGAGLKGTTLDGACPRCGLALSGTLHLPAIDPATMTVCTDVPCRACEYNLRTLALGSVCPECGSPVAPSLAPMSLEFVNIGWLTDQRTIASLTLGALLIPVAILLLFLLFAVGLGGVFLVVLLVLAAIMPMVLPVGLFLLCTQDRDHVSPRYVERLPRLGGLCVTGGLCLGLFWAALWRVALAGPLMLGAAGCCWFGVCFCAARSIGYTAERAGSRRLRRLATLWAYSLVILMAIFFTDTLAFAVGDRVVARNSMLFASVWMPVVPAVVAAYLLGILAIGNYRSVLSDVIRRQGGNARVLGRDGTKGHRDKGEAVCR